MTRRVLLLGGQTVCLGLMTAFLVVPVSALFLDTYGADALPYVYIGVAAAGVGVSAAMTRAQRSYPLPRLAVGVIGAYLLAVAAGWLVLLVAEAHWVTFPLLVLFPLSIPIGFVLVGSQAGRLLDVRQMKAHFPRIAAGFSVGFALGGLAAAALVRPVGGPRLLLGLDLPAAGAMLALVVATARSYPRELDDPPAPPVAQLDTQEHRRRPTGWRVLLSNRMVRLILGYQVLSAAVTQLLDFIVWERAAARYPDPSRLTQFQGVFGGLMNVISVLFVVGFAGWLLTRYGLRFGLAANPAGVVALLAATTVVGSTAGAAGSVFFTLVCVQAVTDISLTDGTTRASVNATYQALPQDQRLRAQTLVEGAGVPLALGSVGVLLIANDLLGFDVRAVTGATLVLSVLWLTWAVLAFREYGGNLRATLARRAWDPVALRIDDASSRQAVDTLLHSRDVHDVQTALDALADNGEDVTDHVVALLEDPDPARRVLGLQVAATGGLLAAPAVTAHVEWLAEDDDREVAAHAAAALVHVGGPAAESGRSAWLTARDAPDPATVGAALRAAADLPHPFFVPHLVELASSPVVAADVLDALGEHADHLAPHVGRVLDDPDVPLPVRERLIHLLGRAATPDARDLLVAHLDDGDPAVVAATAECLVTIGHREAAEDLDLDLRLSALADRVGRCLEVRAVLGDGPRHRPLQDALGDEIRSAGLRATVLLGLVHGARAVDAAVSALGRDDSRARSSALEMLEVSAGRRLAPTAIALVDPVLDDATRRRDLGGDDAASARSLAECLVDLVVDRDGWWGDSWLRACAMYALPDALGARAVALVRPFLDDTVPHVAETARFVAGRVSSADGPAAG